MEETALVDGLKTGLLGGAGFDVFEVEPLPADSPLLTFDNVLLSAHTQMPVRLPGNGCIRNTNS